MRIRTAPSKAIFLVKFTTSPIFICGSCTVPKSWILKDIPSRKITSKVPPIRGWTPKRKLRPPNRSRTPVPTTAAVGAGVPHKPDNVRTQQSHDQRCRDDHISIESQSLSKAPVEKSGQSARAATAGAGGQVKPLTPEAETRATRQDLGRDYNECRHRQEEGGRTRYDICENSHNRFV